MTSINHHAVYVEVPPTIIHPAQWRPGEASPRPRRGGSHPKCENSRSEQPPPSWQDKSITYTHPSEVAKDALINLLSLPATDPRRRNDQVCGDFVKYLDQCEQKGFIIKGYDTKKGKIINLPMSYNNRWGPVRRRELSEKLDRLEFWFNAHSDSPITMITLTAYHPDEVTVQDAWFKLNESRGKLLKLIKKYCGNPDYFWVCEPHPEKDAGYAHYHLAVFADVSNDVKDSQGRGLEDKLRDLWSRKYKTGSHTYGLDFSKNKDEIASLKNYLVKYLRPGFLLDGWSIGTLIFNAHLWENKFRLYSGSKAISHIMKISDEKESDIVWLETRMQTVELTAENEELPVDEVVWDRDYIPDFIEHSLWTRETNKLDWQWWYGINIIDSDTPRDKIYHCNWGRPYKGMKYFEQTIPKLKLYSSNMSTEEQDRRRIQRETEEQYNKEPIKPQLTLRQRLKLERDGYF